MRPVFPDSSVCPRRTQVTIYGGGGSDVEFSRNYPPPKKVHKRIIYGPTNRNTFSFSSALEISIRHDTTTPTLSSNRILHDCTGLRLEPSPWNTNLGAQDRSLEWGALPLSIPPVLAIAQAPPCEIALLEHSVIDLASLFRHTECHQIRFAATMTATSVSV